MENEQDSGDFSALFACCVASTSFFTPDSAMEDLSDLATTSQSNISDRIVTLEREIRTHYFLRDPLVLSPDSCLHNHAYVSDYLLHEFIDPVVNPETTD